MKLHIAQIWNRSRSVCFICDESPKALDCFGFIYLDLVTSFPVEMRNGATVKMFVYRRTLDASKAINENDPAIQPLLEGLEHLKPLLETTVLTGNQDGCAAASDDASQGHRVIDIHGLLLAEVSRFKCYLFAALISECFSQLCLSSLLGGSNHRTKLA